MKLCGLCVSSEEVGLQNTFSGGKEFFGVVDEGQAGELGDLPIGSLFDLFFFLAAWLRFVFFQKTRFLAWLVDIQSVHCGTAQSSGKPPPVAKPCNSKRRSFFQAAES